MANQAQSSSTTELLCDKINDLLRKAILEEADHEIKDASVVLLDYIYEKTNSAIAAANIIAAARNSQDVESYLCTFSLQIQCLACDYSFLQAQLVSLVVSITRLRESYLPSDVRSKFSAGFVGSLADTTKSNYGHLFEESRRTPDLIRNHIYLNCFIARLLPYHHEASFSSEVLSDFDDALFILSTTLEVEHDSSHGLPNVDVPAAAQYMIHAGKRIYNECIEE